MDGEERWQRARQAAAALGAEGIDAVALTYVDMAGVTRVKAVPTARLPQAARHGVGMSPCFDVFTSDDSMTATPHLGGPDGDLRLVPDLDRLTALAGQPGWAWAPVDRYDQQGVPHPACQRQFARRMVQWAAAQGIEAVMGFETEWVVSAADSATDPAADPAGEPFRAAAPGAAYGMDRLVGVSDYLRDLVRALGAQGLDVHQIHPEYAPGQFEVSTAPGDPLAAADDVLLVRQTVRAVSARHGLRVTFSPAVVAGQVGNGCHLHVSLRKDSEDLFTGGTGRFGLTAAAESFLAGVLDALPALMALGAPSPASYLRLAPSRWAGVYRCWGLENREAALRLIAPAEPGGGNAELKPFDAAANPYLLVGAVLAAGLAGIRAGGALPEPVQGDPAVGGVDVPRLPGSLAEAATAFEESTLLREALGEVLHGAVLAVRRAETEAAAGQSPEELAAAFRWRY